MKREAIVGLGKGQLYFPFMLDITPSSEYIKSEVPFMKQCHERYEALSHQHLPLNDFLILHYCNPDSLFYGAEKFYNDNHPQILPDGYILNWQEYNRLNRTTP